MRLWGGNSPKRTYTWSNNWQVKVLATAKLTQAARLSCPVQTTDRYKDKNNKSRFTGNRHLKRSQSWPKLLKALDAFVLGILIGPQVFLFSTFFRLRIYPFPFAKQIIDNLAVFTANRHQVPEESFLHSNVKPKWYVLRRGHS